MRDIDPFTIRLFLSVLEEGSIGKAAAREFIVPSAASKRIGELEAMFRMPLLERGAKGVTPTPAGQALQHHARMVLQAMDRLHGEMSEYVDGVRGRIRVMAGVSSLASHLPGDIQEFMRTHERISIDLEENTTPRIFRAVLQGTADVGIAPNIANHEGLQIYPYRSLTLAVVMPDGHPLAKKTQLSYAETLEFEQVELGRSSGLSALLDTAVRDFTRAKRTRIRVHSYETICRMVASGMGIGVVPLFFAQSHGKMFGLHFARLTDAWADPMICIAVRENAPLPSAAKAFVDHLQQRGMDERLQDSLLDVMRKQREAVRKASAPTPQPKEKTVLTPAANQAGAARGKAA